MCVRAGAGADTDTDIHKYQYYRFGLNKSTAIVQKLTEQGRRNGVWGDGVLTEPHSLLVFLKQNFSSAYTKLEW